MLKSLLLPSRISSRVSSRTYGKKYGFWAPSRVIPEVSNVCPLVKYICRDVKLVGLLDVSVDLRHGALSDISPRFITCLVQLQGQVWIL